MTNSELDAAVEISRALGHPARVRVLAMLRLGELCVCQITEVLELAQSTVSSHLRELRRAGLITERKEGRWVFFSISGAPEVRPWIEAAVGMLTHDPQIEADGNLVDAIRQLPVEDLCRLGFKAATAKAAEEHIQADLGETQ